MLDDHLISSLKSTTPPSRLGRGTPRSRRLARDIAIILVIKLVALITIKVMWFSDPPTTARAEVARILLDSTDQDTP